MYICSITYDPKNKEEKRLAAVMDAFFRVTLDDASRGEREIAKGHKQINFVLEGCEESPDTGEGSNEP